MPELNFKRSDFLVEFCSMLDREANIGHLANLVCRIQRRVEFLAVKSLIRSGIGLRGID